MATPNTINAKLTRRLTKLPRAILNPCAVSSTPVKSVSPTTLGAADPSDTSTDPSAAEIDSRPDQKNCRVDNYQHQYENNTGSDRRQRLR